MSVGEFRRIARELCQSSRTYPEQSIILFISESTLLQTDEVSCCVVKAVLQETDLIVFKGAREIPY